MVGSDESSLVRRIDVKSGQPQRRMFQWPRGRKKKRIKIKQGKNHRKRHEAKTKRNEEAIYEAQPSGGCDNMYCKRVPPAQVSGQSASKLGRKGCVLHVLALKDFTGTAGHGMAEDPLPVRLYHKEPLTDKSRLPGSAPQSLGGWI